MEFNISLLHMSILTKKMTFSLHTLTQRIGKIGLFGQLQKITRWDQFRAFSCVSQRSVSA